jgi:HlyD family secretion protein
MKKKALFILILAVTLLALLGMTACESLGGAQDTVSEQRVEVTRGDITVSVTGSGKMETSREARLTFGSGGKLDRILVKEGDEVKAGDVLARLDISTLELAYAQSEVALTQAQTALAQAQLAQKTAEYNLSNTRDSEDTLKLALLNAQIGLDTAKDNLTNTIKSYNWDTFEKIESELNKAQAFYDYAYEGLQGKFGGETYNWELLLERAAERLEAAQADYDNFLAGHSTARIDLSKKQVEAAEMSVAQAQKNLDKLDDNIALQELQVSSAEKAVEQAQQSVDLAQESLDEAQRQLDEASIIAPFDGVIAAVMAEEGDIIPSPSMAPKTIIHMINPDYLELVIEVDEIDIPQVSLGEKAVISVDALPDASFQGLVTAVYPLPQEVGGVVLYNVKIGLDVPDNSGIRVGMSASADIMIAERSNVLLVPSRAIEKDDQGNTIVKVMVGDEQAEARPVVVGLDDGLRAEIISGLSEGETVVFEVRVKSSPMSMF